MHILKFYFQPEVALLLLSKLIDGESNLFTAPSCILILLHIHTRVQVHTAAHKREEKYAHHHYHSKLATKLPKEKREELETS